MSSLLTGLNEPQTQAVLHQGSSLLLVAGPGSGKTRVLTHRIAYALAPKGRNLPADRILGVTFTNKAANEMQQRIRQLRPHSQQRPELCTYHAFGARLLRANPQNGYVDPAFSILDQDDQRAMLKTVMEMQGLSTFRRAARNLLTMISGAKNAGQTPEELAAATPPDQGEFTPQQLGELYAGYEALIHSQNCLDFDDLLLYPLKILENNDRLRGQYQRRYQEILVDEFQDTNELQYRLVELLTARKDNVCVVGDPDQTIYQWRGAAAGSLTRFKKEFHAHVIPLGQNYRSTPEIVAGSANLISHNPEREPIDLFTENPSGPAVQVKPTYNRAEEAQEILAEVKELLQKGYEPEDIAVLYRTNRQSRLLEREAARSEIPYRLLGGIHFWSRREIKDILAYLLLLDNPEHRIATRRALSVPPQGIGAKTLARLQEHAEKRGCSLLQAAAAAVNPFSPLAAAAAPLNLSAKARQGLAQFQAKLADLRRKSQAEAPRALIAYLLIVTGLDQHIQSYENPQERWENVEELLLAAQEYAAEPPPAGLKSLLANAALTPNTNQEPANALTLSTIHQAKGLEWRAVFLAGMNEGTLPGSRTLAEGSLAEERRVCYVAMTRAKERLTLYQADFVPMPQGSERPGEPSRFLEEILSPPAEEE